MNSYSYYLDAIVNEQTGETYRPGSGYEELPAHVKEGHRTVIAHKAAYMLASETCGPDFIESEIRQHWNGTIDVANFMKKVYMILVSDALEKRERNKQ